MLNLLRVDAASARAVAICLGIVSLVGDRSARPDVGSDIEKNLEIATITGFAAGQMKRERQPVEIDLEVDFRREAAALAERLILLPPFAPAAETWARTTVESNICTRCAISLMAASASKKASKVPDWLKCQDRFHTLFQWQNRRGSARHVMLWTAKYLQKRAVSRRRDANFSRRPVPSIDKLHRITGADAGLPDLQVDIILACCAIPDCPG